MDPRHRELARIGLAATQNYGFALAGGYALATHGLVNRATEDVDLFTNNLDPDEFTGAVEAISAAYEQAGHPVSVVRRAELYARLHVGQDDPVQIELAYDWRSKIPARFDIGPVLDRDDVVAGKVLALWGRQEARDYIDVHAALASGEYTEGDLLPTRAARGRRVRPAHVRPSPARSRRPAGRRFRRLWRWGGRHHSSTAAAAKLGPRACRGRARELRRSWTDACSLRGLVE